MINFYFIIFIILTILYQYANSFHSSLFNTLKASSYKDVKLNHFTPFTSSLNPPFSPFSYVNIIENKKNSNKLFQLYGIPKMFRWLIDLYPSILNTATQSLPKQTSPSIVDNFYLDMNGIIHAFSNSNQISKVKNKDGSFIHPYDLPKKTENEIFDNIFNYLDRLVKLVRPQNLLYLAIDGVAPRAKMNQQRSRRFRAAKDREQQILEYYLQYGRLPGGISSQSNEPKDMETVEENINKFNSNNDLFDSNAITPGTDFLHRLSIALDNWLKVKVKNDEEWRKLNMTVIFSPPSVPGEGEHKIMDKIREIQKDLKNNPQQKNIRHCLYGLDADLIMLGLVTHEPNFILLRENMKARMGGKDPLKYVTNDFDVLEIGMLREMINEHFVDKYNYNFKTSNINNNNNDLDNKKALYNKKKLKNFINDFVFICFFIGNDFLPPLPHLDIADGALNLLVKTYKSQQMSSWGSSSAFLTNGAEIHLPRLEIFLKEISRREPLYFSHRSMEDNEEGFEGDGYKDYYYKTKFGIEPGDIEARKKIVREYLRALFWVSSYYHTTNPSWKWYYPYHYAPLASDMCNLAELAIDFNSTFSYKDSTKKENHMWHDEYPLHPSERRTRSVSTFEKGKPFPPLAQLISVLPPQSKQLLPKIYRDLLSSFEIDSVSNELAQYFPSDFLIDMNGKKNSWEWVVSLPFLPQHLLLETLSNLSHHEHLTEEEKIRNLSGEDIIYNTSTSN